MMYHSILVPLDGSPFGEHALPYALDIARRTSAQIHLAHVYDTPPQLLEPPAADLLASLHSSPDGLATSDARQCLQQYGPNLFEPQPQATALRLLLGQFRNPLILPDGLREGA